MPSSSARTLLYEHCCIITEGQDTHWNVMVSDILAKIARQEIPKPKFAGTWISPSAVRVSRESVDRDDTTRTLSARV